MFNGNIIIYVQQGYFNLLINSNFIRFFIDDESCPNELHVELTKTKTVEEIDIIHAIAKFKNSPFSSLTLDDISSLQRFICS